MVLTSALIALISMPMVSMVASVVASGAANGEATVHGLRQAGWKVINKTTRDEWHPGKAPYEDLGSLVYMVTYTLHKEGKTVTCTIARNMMQDTFKESCRPEN